MNKIGFQNFRRFQNFELLEYKGITFLVGRNNAGKSTLVKALLLLNDYFRSNNYREFSFGNNVLEDANIVSFGRAKNSKAKDEFIIFFIEKGNYRCEIILTGDQDKTYAKVYSLSISDSKNNIDFLYNIVNSSFALRRKIDTSVSSNEMTGSVTLIQEEIKRLKNEIASSTLKKSSKEYLLLVEEYNALVNKAKFIDSIADAPPEKSYTLEASFDDDFDLPDMLGFMLYSAEVDHDNEFAKIQQGEKPSENFETNRAIKEDSKLIEKSFNDFFNLFKHSNIIYLGANSTKQAALFPIRDRNNALAQAIHDFYQLRISPGQTAYEFLEKWMKEFEVGDSFAIDLHAGEAYEVKISSNDSEIHLADKGMGSIQAMLLILRLACIIHKTKSDSKRTTLLIEEPELNLHPALQSKLADLFLHVHQSHDIDFIIETHSEYILRKSQVFVAENEFEVAPNENPYYVYYFPKNIDEQPYRLEYREDGAFAKNFGDGFFDEASKRTLELLRLKREKKS